MSKDIDITDAEGNTRKVPLLDFATVMQQHQQRFPVEITGGALVFGAPRSTRTQEINFKYREFIKDYYSEAEAEALRIMQKAEADRTDEEEKKLAEFTMASRPYSVELIHSQLLEPVLTLEQFKQLIDTLPPIDWVKIQLHVAGINKKLAEAMSGNAAAAPN